MWTAICSMLCGALGFEIIAGKYWKYKPTVMLVDKRSISFADMIHLYYTIHLYSMYLCMQTWLTKWVPASRTKTPPKLSNGFPLSQALLPVPLLSLVISFLGDHQPMQSNRWLHVQPNRHRVVCVQKNLFQCLQSSATTEWMLNVYTCSITNVQDTTPPFLEERLDFGRRTIHLEIACVCSIHTGFRESIAQPMLSHAALQARFSPKML